MIQTRRWATLFGQLGFMACLFKMRRFKIYGTRNCYRKPMGILPKAEGIQTKTNKMLRKLQTLKSDT